MQTFLPYADFARSAAALDARRLGKQRVETLQIMNALTYPGHGWQNHPAVRMWRGFRPALMRYQEAVCAEWTGRGFADTCREKTLHRLAEVPADGAVYASGVIPMPDWLADEALHRSHRSNLLRKDPLHYGVFFGDLPDDLPYIWPVPQMDAKAPGSP